MAKQTNKFSARRVATETKPGMHADGNGLYLQVAKSGSKSWSFRFMLHGRSRDMGLGSVTLTSLSDARALALDARRLVKAGIDPIEQRNAKRRQQKTILPSFEECARRYISTHEVSWKNPKHRAQWTNTLQTYAFPIMGGLPIDAVDTGLVLQVIEPIWATKTETASRIRGRIETILDWAAARGYRAGENPARWRGHLDKLLPKRSKVQRVKHHAALPYVEMPSFMRLLRAQDGIAARALEFQILTAARPGEVVQARWEDIGDDVWTVPAERMKAGKEHRVPLVHAATTLIREMAKDRRSDYVFRGQRKDQPLWTDAFLRQLERIDYADLTAHGFRSTFRDWAAEQTGFPRELAESALAHVVTGVEAAYRRSDLFDKRRSLMVAWAGFCDQEPKVIPLRVVAKA